MSTLRIQVRTFSEPKPSRAVPTFSISTKELGGSQEKFRGKYREFLGGVVERIDIHLDQQTFEHDLKITFCLPIVDDSLEYLDPDRKSAGYQVKDGLTRKTARSKKIQPAAA